MVLVFTLIILSVILFLSLYDLGEVKEAKQWLTKSSIGILVYFLYSLFPEGAMPWWGVIGFEVAGWGMLIATLGLIGCVHGGFYYDRPESDS